MPPGSWAAPWESASPDLRQAHRHSGPLPRGAGLSRRGHRSLCPLGSPGRAGRGPSGSGGHPLHLRPGPGAPPGHPGGDPRQAQRREVQPLKRVGGLRPGHRHRRGRNHPGHRGGDRPRWAAICCGSWIPPNPGHRRRNRAAGRPAGRGRRRPGRSGHLRLRRLRAPDRRRPAGPRRRRWRPRRLSRS